MGNHVGEGDVSFGAGATVLELHQAVGQAPADDDDGGDADEFGVFELDAGRHALASYVHRNGDADDAILADAQEIDMHRRILDRIELHVAGNDLCLLAVDIDLEAIAAQAQAGFQREETAGIPEARRSYRDAMAKPELVVALTEFEALCGFRPPAEGTYAAARAKVKTIGKVSEDLVPGGWVRANEHRRPLWSFDP